MERTNRLERALDALSRERKRWQREMVEVTGRRSALSSAIERLEGCRNAVLRTSILDESGALRCDLYLVARSAETRIATEIKELEGRLATFDKEVTGPMEERLRAAAVRERAVETIVTKRKTLVQKEVEQKELAQMDEHAQIRWQSNRVSR